MKKLITFLILTICLSAKAISQCAMCKAVVEKGDNKMGEGINSGIGYLILFPYLFLAIGIIYYYKQKSKK